MPAVVNPLTAACHEDFVPDEVRILSNPAVRDDVESARSRIETVVDAYGGDVAVESHELTHETEFEAIAEFYRTAVDTDTEEVNVAVDVTPGRKFMSALAFQAGIRFDADHVYYFHRKSGPYRWQYYPEIPRTATDLIDFTEVLQ